MKYLNSLDNRGVLERIDQIEGQDESSRFKQRLKGSLSKTIPLATIPNAAQTATSRARSTAAALAVMNQTVVGVTKEGTIALCPDTARNYLAWHFDRNIAVGDTLPRGLRDWVTEQGCVKGSGIPARPFSTQREGRRLTIHLLCGQTTRYRLLLLEETRVQFSAEVLKSHFGLSARRAEVLLWLAQGKTSNQIAIILGLSISTVHKHTERVFEKLGVENRMAAARRAAQVMDRAS